jgi:hypothetical protein
MLELSRTGSLEAGRHRLSSRRVTWSKEGRSNVGEEWKDSLPQRSELTSQQFLIKTSS